MTSRWEGPRAKHGFTLVELLVAISILALLSSLTFPAVRIAIESSRRAKCAEHLRQIGQVILAESLSSGGFPYRAGATGAETLAILYERGAIPEEEVFSCPGSGRKCTDIESVRTDGSFAFRTGLRSLPTTGKAIPIACDASVEHHKDGVNVLYSDGRVVFVRCAEIPEGLAK